MSVIVSHPTGNANVRALARGLHNRRMLHSFYTTINTGDWGELSQLFPPKLRSELNRRSFSDMPRDLVRTRPAREVVRQIARRIGLNSLVAHEIGWASAHQVYYDLDQYVATSIRAIFDDELRIIYAYEDGAKLTFEAARDLRLNCVYELPSPYWKSVLRIIEGERERYPDWLCTIDAFFDSQASRNRKDEELELATQIVVPTHFAKRCLEEHTQHGDKTVVVPYGAPKVLATNPSRRRLGEELKILFAGRLSQSKGLADLIQAVHAMDNKWHVTIAGALPTKRPRQLDEFLSRDNVSYLGFANPATLFQAMHQAHVFVLPSLYEGFGMVILEAMAAGLPVITTDNTGGSEVIEEGESGFIVPIREPGKIADRLTRIAENEDLRKKMSNNALAAADGYSWDRYEAQISEVLRALSK